MPLFQSRKGRGRLEVRFDLAGWEKGGCFVTLAVAGGNVCVRQGLKSLREKSSSPSGGREEGEKLQVPRLRSG